MHLGLPALLDFYRAHRCDDALVLGTVIATEGSTYRKPGAMILIASDGSYCGLISGGCLEADLAAHAASVFTDGVPRKISYDLNHADDFSWGLGLGCDGAIHLLLQRLDAEDGFGFLEKLDQIWRVKNRGLLSLVTSSDNPDHLVGSFTLRCGEDIPNAHAKPRRFWQDSIETSNGEVKQLLIPITPPTALLICGAGHDALPVARLAVEMDWDCTLVDHRSGFARADRFPEACSVLEIPASELGSSLSLDQYDATIIMSHHLDHDRNYLEQTIAAEIPYIGLLGPRARRDRLINEVGAQGDAKGTHIHGPAGLDIGAEMPKSIALAIIAEIHAFLNGRSGTGLSIHNHQ